ncbi:carbon starvation CstA family protein, partial [Aeromonas hydrophila]
MQHAITFVIAALCILAIAYRLYGVFFVRKVLMADDKLVTPSHQLEDGKNYVPTNKWVNFGQHFAAIAAAGPLVGPVLAAQYGYLPSFLWLLIGCVIGGAVHDTVVLFASMKHQGKSLSEVAKAELGPIAGWCTGLAMLFIITITMAGLSMVVVHALERNAWGVFAVFMTIPISMVVGIWHKLTGNLQAASWVGFIAVLACVFFGPYVQESAFGAWLTLRAETISLALPVYAFFATALPVWLLLTPRGYISSFMKIGVFGALVIGVICINPEIQFPAMTQFVHGGGPVLGGPVWPFISITIACGAISGFHAFIGSGTTPKLVDKWSDILPVAFGAMLAECVVGVMALIAATALHPADYFAINATPEAFAKLGMQVVDLPFLSQEIGMDLNGRTGGAVTLAVGMSYIFTKVPWFSNLASYFFQFVVMFEAVFILTAVDSGTRVSRYLIQDFFGEFYPPLKRIDWMPGAIGASVLACVMWGYLLMSGDIGSVWALFGVSNQLMASVGLIIGATIILRLASKRRYMLT